MYNWDNYYGLAAAKQYPSRFKIFGRFDPFAPKAADRLSKWKSQSGSAGVRLTFYGDALKHLERPELLEPFWKAAENLKIRVAIFAPDALWKIVDIIERHPKLKLVIDHLGLGVYPGCEDPFANFKAIFKFKPFPQVLVKISGAVEVSRDAHPFRDAQEIVAEAKHAFGCSRLMWGSNYPVSLSKCSYEQSLEFVEDCNFSAEERELVLFETCQRMLSEGGDLR